MEFEQKIERLSNIAMKKMNEARTAIDKITKEIQKKYPELTAEYSYSDGGIIYIKDTTMEEFYSLEQIKKTIG